MPGTVRIRRVYDGFWKEENSCCRFHITSAVELDKSTVKSLGDKIGEQTGRKVELTSEVEPDILGGIVVRVGNSIIDASVRSRLEKLRRQVAKA